MASELSNPQSLTLTAVARGPIWLCTFGSAVLHGCTVHTRGVDLCSPHQPSNRDSVMQTSPAQGYVYRGCGLSLQ